MTAAANFLKENNAKQIWHPMGHPNEMESDPPRILTSAEGVHVTDLDGHRLLDAVGGLWNVNLGYSCQPIKDAIARQLAELPYCTTFRGTSHPTANELSHRLVEMMAPERMTRAFFTSGGSDSVETALRLARQYWKLRGQADRTKFIALKKGYHGTHFGGASVNGNANFRRNYEPLLPGCFHVPAPFAYRNPFDEDDPERLGRLAARMIEEEIAFQGAGTVAALIAEPVMGAGGVIVPPDNFWPLLRETCDRHDILLIADEVITGFGRAGAQFGSRGWGVAPDMMCIAKAITSGYFPLGATMVGEKVEAAFKANNDPTGSIGHGYTYSGHPVGCAAALAALDVMAEMDLPANAKRQGEDLLTRLKALQLRHPIVGDVRGKGLMVALELVSDRVAKTPAPKDLMRRVADRTAEAGVLIRVSGNVIILSPPLILEGGHIAEIAEALDAGLAAA
jgi:adenosylmethionine-8-amino-7-oxononanoate aminotransferase